ncbi:MAG: hypothetical protein D9C04_04735 [Nitrosopumilus sp. B06]|nr:MAG: hypothetical protein EB828_06685 [Nitrosopumilus sp. D6]RNJ79518.1 MAG: hypothetical protein D9C04_04735 [Nitrosopumilus sp. B06]
MRSEIFAILVMGCLAAIPHGVAQDLPDAEQSRIEVVIDSQGDASVKHRVTSSTDPTSLKFVGEPAHNLRITDGLGDEIVSTDVTGAVIPADSGEVLVEYELQDYIRLVDRIWTLDFLYHDSVVFTIPDEAELVFVNEQPVYTEFDKRFACHGCQMILEYITDEPNNMEVASWEDREFPVEIRTYADVGNFEFNQAERRISFDVNDAGTYVITIFDLELLGKPYAVLYDGNKTTFHGYDISETRVGITMKPDAPGRVTIIGTTVIPEFSVFAPLVAGFMAVLVYPLLKRFSFH